MTLNANTSISMLPCQIKYLKDKLFYSPIFGTSAFQKGETSDKKSYTSFIASHKEKIIHQSIPFELIIMGYNLLLKAIGKPW